MSVSPIAELANQIQSGSAEAAKFAGFGYVASTLSWADMVELEESGGSLPLPASLPAPSVPCLCWISLILLCALSSASACRQTVSSGAGVVLSDEPTVPSVSRTATTSGPSTGVLNLAPGDDGSEDEDDLIVHSTSCKH